MTSNSKNMRGVPHIPSASIHTMALVEHLRTTEAVIVTDEEMSSLVGGGSLSTAVKGVRYPNLMSALRILRRDHRIVWAREKGQGHVKRLDCGEGLTVARGCARRARHVATRSIQTMRAFDPAVLEPARRLEYVALATQARLILECSESRTLKAIAARQQKPDGSASLPRLLAAIVASSGENDL